MKLQAFLNQKPLYYKEIDVTRMPRAYASIKEQIRVPKIIHLIGTNGKGSTGRFLANALLRSGHTCTHYTSPHILKFNERIYENGHNITDEHLEVCHEQLQKLLSKEFLEGLSYFEYTTFLAILAAKESEYLVLEAGLGGEFDATNVFAKEVSIVTPIGFDHESFLGNTIEAIATTKINAVTNTAFVSTQQFLEVSEVLACAKQERDICYCDSKTYLSEQEQVLAQELITQNNLASFMLENLYSAMAVFKFLGKKIQKSFFDGFNLAGRMQRVQKNVLLDVGHNVLAAKQIVKACQNQKFVLVYNSYEDKDYKQIAKILAPIIKRVEIIEIEDERIALKEEIQNAFASYEVSIFQEINEQEEYLVFGSFMVAEAFLKAVNE